MAATLAENAASADITSAVSRPASATTIGGCLAAAQEYTRAGLSVTPTRGKAATLVDWTGRRLKAAELATHFAPPGVNVGVLNGVPSHGLIDVDVDAPEAVACAAQFLPSTLVIFGRPGKPRSHFEYLVAGAGEPPKTRKFEDVDGTTLVELRSTGTQTVWPPSIHPSGEETDEAGSRRARHGPAACAIDRSARMARPIVRYATTADGLEIAYQVWGDGPIDIVIVPGLTSNVDRNADYPFYGGYLRRFPRFARTIVLDRRGAGISDREVGSGSAEDRMDDVRAVMDAVGCRRAALLGHREGGSIAILFAATYPDRASALVLIETAARESAAPDYPAGRSAESGERFVARFRATWGTGRATFRITSDAPDAEAAVEALGALERSIGTPRSMVRQLQFGMELDVRSALPLIDVPTLVMHSPHAPWPEAQARYTAEHIRAARFVDMPGSGSWDAVKQDARCDVIEEFLTGQRPPVGDIDRVLATVLFTDIVDSTRRVTELGDRRWRGVLDALDARAAAEVGRFRGRVVKQTGDGMLATFDGPARAIRCARAVADAARVLGLELRAGLHAGEIEMRGGDVSGLAVHIGARIGALASAGEVLVSATVRDLVVGSGLEFDERGEHELRGIEGRWRLLAVRPERGTHA